MLSLNNRTALVKSKKRVGRGGKRGGTSCRGHKGQNARSGGGVAPSFEGGQMPLTRRLPKRGFNNARFAQEWVTVNISALNVFEEGTTVSKSLLLEKGTIKCGKKARLKILGCGELEKTLTVQADAFSKSAQEAITKRGGEAQITKEM